MVLVNLYISSFFIISTDAAEINSPVSVEIILALTLILLPKSVVVPKHTQTVSQSIKNTL
jgi:hypothetical protein